MEFIEEENRIYLSSETGRLLAEVTFPNISEQAVTIDHTFVDPSLRGQGIAEKLLSLAVQKIKRENFKVYPTCSYAVKWFGEHKEEQDILIEKI